MLHTVPAYAHHHASEADYILLNVGIGQNIGATDLSNLDTLPGDT